MLPLTFCLLHDAGLEGSSKDDRGGALQATGQEDPELEEEAPHGQEVDPVHPAHGPHPHRRRGRPRRALVAG